MANIQSEDLAKALAELQDIAKGHNSRGTVTTEVDSMRDGSVGAGSDAGSTQVHHTANNSDPGTWAGTKQVSTPDNGATDNVSENATDYDGVLEKVFKSIVDKISKGETLSDTERAFMKSYSDNMEKGKNPFAKDDDDDDDVEKGDMKITHDGDDDGKVEKSLHDFAAENADVSKGLEVSEFLAGFADVMHKSIAASEARVMAHVSQLVSSTAANTGAFQKSLAESVIHLGEAVSATAQRVEQVESTPARGAKSVQNVQALTKGSFEGPVNLENIDKSLIGATLVELQMNGQCAVEDVVRFESTGHIDGPLTQKVVTKISGR